jgi:iron complex outermembrane receptor protein
MSLCSSRRSSTGAFLENQNTNMALRQLYTPLRRIGPRRWPAAALLSLASIAGAQTTVGTQTSVDVPTLDPVVVTATRRAARSFDVPASTDRIDAATIQNGQPMINLSETLVRVPGIVTFNRQNYAQDLQISSRGFGARSTFGVRGVRLYQDDIPVTMPDGQGQTGSFNLFSAESIEILRGPFSTLYGNASGGVISVMTEDGKLPPSFGANASVGSYGSHTWGLKASGRAGPAGYVVANSHFDTDGYRDHSAATRDVVNAKVTLGWGDTTRLTVLAGTQDQYRTEDPLGLSRAQWEANPRQVDPVAIMFDTNKTIRQQQAGATLEHKLGAATVLRATGYAGHRNIRQFLGLNGGGATASGGVVDLDRDFGGLAFRITHTMQVFGRPLNLIAGADIDRQDEHRQGFVNNNGALGDLRRDEDDRVTSVDGYAQIEWLPVDALSLTAGLRHSDVRFVSDDHYIAGPNPDDSGRRNFSRASPVFGAVWHATPDINAYASYGQGFETPTFAELAYRTAGTGLNFALGPATSKATEIGVKAFVRPNHRINVAAFAIDTKDEIVTDTNVGGRTTFRNAGATRRRGVEAAWDANWAFGLTSRLAYTHLRATFDDAFRSGADTVAAGARMPGVPATTAYGEIAWSPAIALRPQVAVEVVHVGKIYVNDRNSDAAPRYTIANVRIGLEQQFGALKLKEYARLNNVADRRYAGSVIVGEGNGRFFEPAPGRNWVFGISAEANY